MVMEQSVDNNLHTNNETNKQNNIIEGLIDTHEQNGSTTTNVNEDEKQTPRLLVGEQS